MCERLKQKQTVRSITHVDGHCAKQPEKFIYIYEKLVELRADDVPWC